MTLDESRRLHINDLVVSTANRVLYGRVVAFNAAGHACIAFEDESYATIVFPSQAERLRFVPHWKDLPDFDVDAEDDAA